MSAPVTVGILSHNRRAQVGACLDALAAQEPRPARVILVDNGSTDGTAAFVRATHPEVEVVALPTNTGLGAARNVALRLAETELVLLIDEDILLEPGCLARLVAAMDRPEVAVAAPLIVYRDRPDVAQYAGFDVHFLCIGIARPAPAVGRQGAPYAVTAVAGGAMLVRRSAALAVGLFNELFFFGREDGEFCARLTQAGYGCLQVPAAVVRHDIAPRAATFSCFFQIRNRWLYMLRLYALSTLCVLAPALLAYEAALLGLCLATGQLRVYWRAVRSLAGAWPAVREQRRQTHALRALPDVAWLTTGRFAPGRALAGRHVRALAASGAAWLLVAYWRLVRPLLAALTAPRRDRVGATPAAPPPRRGTLEGLPAATTGR